MIFSVFYTDNRLRWNLTLELGTSKKELSVRKLVNVLRSKYGIPYFCVAYNSYNLIISSFSQFAMMIIDGFVAHRMYLFLHLIITSNICMESIKFKLSKSISVKLIRSAQIYFIKVRILMTE